MKEESRVSSRVNSRLDSSLACSQTHLRDDDVVVVVLNDIGLSAVEGGRESGSGSSDLVVKCRLLVGSGRGLGRNGRSASIS